MGINFLERCMKRQVPNGTQFVSIPDEIYRYQTSQGRNPLIVIDLKPFLRWGFVSDKSAFLCGARSQDFEKKLRQFFSKLSVGVRIVGFSDGPPQLADHWCLRHDEKLADQMLFLDQIERGSSYFLSQGAPVQYLSSFDRTLFQIVRECGGEVRFAIKADNDSSVARYATQNNALAVLSKDTDFLIFAGKWRYWSVHDIDPETLRTIEYSRDALRRYLRIGESQMPLFASLGGNEIVEHEDMKAFLDRIKRGRSYDFRDIVRYLDRLTGDAETRVRRISMDVNQRQDAIFIEKLRKSVEFYDTKAPYEFPEGELQLKMLRMDDPTVYCLYEEIPTEWYPTYWDMSNQEMPSFADLVEKLLARMMGVVLREKYKDGVYKTQTFLCKSTGSEKFETIQIRPIPPEMDEIPLKELLFGEIPDERRFELLAWVVSPTLSAQKLQKLDKNRLSAALAINLLVENGFINEEDADIALISVEHLIKGKVPGNIDPPTKLRKRTFMVSFLIPVVQKMVNHALDCCGLGKWATVQHDGVYFHHLTYEWDKYSDKEKKNLLEEIVGLRFYVEK